MVTIVSRLSDETGNACKVMKQMCINNFVHSTYMCTCTHSNSNNSYGVHGMVVRIKCHNDSFRQWELLDFTHTVYNSCTNSTTDTCILCNTSLYQTIP